MTASTSPSMDIQVSSNFERLLFEVHGRDPNDVRRLMAEPRAVRRLHHRRARTGADPRRIRLRRHRRGGDRRDHPPRPWPRRASFSIRTRAVGYAVARPGRASASPMVTLATAHPAKFPDAVEKASGVRPAFPKRLDHLLAAKERFTVLPNDVGRGAGFHPVAAAGLSQRDRMSVEITRLPQRHPVITHPCRIWRRSRSASG